MGADDGTGRRLHRPGTELKGRREIRRFVHGFHQAFPDATHRIDRFLVAGDTLIMEGVFTGTHTGVLRTPTGDVPPTGRHVEVREVQLVTIDRGGLAVRFDTYFDRLKLLAQFGFTGH